MRASLSQLKLMQFVSNLWLEENHSVSLCFSTQRKLFNSYKSITQLCFLDFQYFSLDTNSNTVEPQTSHVSLCFVTQWKV